MEEREPPAEAPQKGGRLSTWIKAAIGTVAGLLSGAAMMYVSPLIDKVVKPARPVANFSVEHEGTAVTFQNCSTGIHDGWWDFGDGSALVAVDPSQQTVTHTYANPGDYTAKLSVTNLLGDESERTVNLHLDAAKPEAPEIQGLDVTPVSPGSYAPATFRVTGKVKNAQMCVWSVGDDRPMEFVKDDLAAQDRLLTFDRPGTYLIKLAAVCDTHTAQKSAVVTVQAPPAGTVAAVLYVSSSATQVDTTGVPVVFSVPFPPGMKEATAPFKREIKARPGCLISNVQVPFAEGAPLQMNSLTEMPLAPTVVKGGNARNLRLVLAPNRHSVTLTGELVKPAGNPGAPVPNVELPVVLLEQRRWATQRPATPVAATLTAPGSAMLMLPPLPASWVDASRQMRLVLQAGNTVLWKDSQLPHSKPVTINNRPYLLTASPVGGQLRVDLTDARGGGAPSGN